MQIGVIGAGKWGLALYSAFSKNHDVYITSRRKRDIKNFVSVDEILECKYLVFALSAQHAREWMEKNFVYKGQKLLVASKGIEIKTGKFLNEIFSEFLHQDDLAFISGPSFASEVMQELPTALVISSSQMQTARGFERFFPSYIKTYSDDDVIGAEVAGAYKNILAIASGVCDGLELGNNARASLIARGLVEMSRFGEFFGARKETFLGLSGAGDLFLSASSKLSRNYRVGFYLSKDEELNEILKKLGEVAEGVATTYAVKNISTKKNIYTPIADEVYAILEGKSPKESLKDLLSK